MFHRSLIVMMLVAVGVRAQDMPLSQILIPGEGWKKIEGKFGPISCLSNQRLEGRPLVVWDADNRPQAVLDETGKLITPTLPEKMTNLPLIAFNRPYAYVINDDRRSLRIVYFPNVKEKIADVPLPVKEASTLM